MWKIFENEKQIHIINKRENPYADTRWDLGEQKNITVLLFFVPSQNIMKRQTVTCTVVARPSQIQ